MVGVPISSRIDDGFQVVPRGTSQLSASPEDCLRQEQAGRLRSEGPALLNQSNGALLLGAVFTLFAASASADEVKQLTIEKAKQR
jgi:hypothetical protein